MHPVNNHLFAGKVKGDETDSLKIDLVAPFLHVLSFKIILKK